MPSEKQIEAAKKALGPLRDTYVDRDDIIKIITAAELSSDTQEKQAEPAPAARSGAVKVDDSLLNALRLSGRISFDEFKQTVLRALEPAEPEVMCVGCEGKPSLGNSPCAVCGKQAAEPAADVESLKLMNGSGLVWEESKPFYAVAKTPDGQIIPADSMREMSRINTAYMAGVKAQPESRLREALEEISRLQAGRSGHGVWRAVKIARSALALEDGR